MQKISYYTLASQGKSADPRFKSKRRPFHREFQKISLMNFPYEVKFWPDVDINTAQTQELLIPH